MIRNASDPSLYHRLDSFGLVLASIIVDDFQITGSSPAAVARLKAQLAEIWDMTDYGPLKFFANVEIRRNRTTMETTMTQTAYVEDMLAKYGLQDTYAKATPCTQSIYHQRLLDPTTAYEPTFEDNYAAQVGTLGYLRRTRPDICVAHSVAAQFAKRGRHGPPHYRAMRNIMRYCSGTPRHDLHYVSTRKGTTDPWDVKGHVDSDWAAWKGTRRSRTGILIYLNGMLVAFGSKLQR